jgi:hypothetical protein
MNLSKIFFCFSLLLFLSQCKNLFNPSGAGDSANLDPQGHLSYCESLLRESRNSEAISECGLALRADSTLSLAYFNLGKATLRESNVNPTIFAELALELQKSEEDSTADPIQGAAGFLEDIFINDSNTIGAINNLIETLQPFLLRDSLQTLYNLTQVDNPEICPTETQTLELFRSQFLSGTISNLSDPIVPVNKRFSYSASDFPLLDGKISATRIEPELMIALTMSAMSDLLAIKNLVKTVEIDGLIEQFSTGEVNLDSVALDSSSVLEFNGLIINSTNGLKSIEGLDPNILAQDGECADLVESEAQATIDSLGNSVTFYQMADKIDNDGDGCIDEELRDGIDNDGDGIIDEDTKFDPFNARDSFDNDQNGQIDEGDELISSGGILAFSSAPGFWGLENGNPDYSYRYKVAQHGANFSTISLNDRITKIGGCWSNY